jgi:hypothetical protein
VLEATSRFSQQKELAVSQLSPRSEVIIEQPIDGIRAAVFSISRSFLVQVDKHGRFQDGGVTKQLPVLPIFRRHFGRAGGSYCNNVYGMCRDRELDPLVSHNNEIAPDRDNGWQRSSPLVILDVTLAENVYIVSARDCPVELHALTHL